MKSYFVSFLIKNKENDRNIVFNVNVTAENKVRAKDKACAKAVVEFPFEFEIESWIIRENGLV